MIYLHLVTTTFCSAPCTPAGAGLEGPVLPSPLAGPPAEPVLFCRGAGHRRKARIGCAGASGGGVLSPGPPLGCPAGSRPCPGTPGCPPAGSSRSTGSGPPAPPTGSPPRGKAVSRVSPGFLPTREGAGWTCCSAGGGGGGRGGGGRGSQGRSSCGRWRGDAAGGGAGGGGSGGRRGRGHCWGGECLSGVAPPGTLPPQSGGSQRTPRPSSGNTPESAPETPPPKTLPRTAPPTPPPSLGSSPPPRVPSTSALCSPQRKGVLAVAYGYNRSDEQSSQQQKQQQRMDAKLTIQLQKQLNMLRKGSKDIRVVVNEEDLCDLQADIVGPVGTPFEKGVLRVRLSLPPDFPASPPKGHFLTKIFHPNVDQLSGEICVNTLKRDWDPQCWSLKNIYEVIRCLLIVPFPESALNQEAAKMFMSDYEEYSRRASMITQLNAFPAQVAPLQDKAPLSTNIPVHPPSKQKAQAKKWNKRI